MKNTNKISCFGIGVLLLMASCTSGFDEMNQDPNKTTKGNAAMLCTNIILSITKYGGDAKSFIANSAFPKYVGYANEGQMGAQYNSVGSGSFGSMTLLPNIDQMNASAQASVDTPIQNSYQGVGKFAKAWIMFRMTMNMGDIPYSEAGLGDTGLLKPKYDTQESVFIHILDDLKAADQFFANGGTFAGDPTPYAGNPEKWRRATNAFALKVLMTLSKKENVTSLDVKNRFAQIVSSGFIMNNATGFFGLAYTNTNRHPLYSTNNLFTTRTLMSTVIINPLKALNDRRLFYYADPSKQQLNAGKLETDPDAYIGADVSATYASLNAGWGAKKFSILNTRYQTNVATESRMLLTFAEQQLILAEAVIRGWIGGTAQTYYEDGVKAALTNTMAAQGGTGGVPVGPIPPHHNMPITSAYINGYFTGEAAFKATTTEQLQQIWLQRYILNFMQNGDYSYYEYRRTNYPNFPINPATNLNTTKPNAIPLRWTYPGSEVQTNTSNLNDAVSRQFGGFDEVNKSMWLLN